MVELPVRVAWSGQRVFDLDNESDRHSMYALLLAEARRRDLECFVDGDLLVQMWPRLRPLLGPHARREWERNLMTTFQQ